MVKITYSGNKSTYIYKILCDIILNVESNSYNKLTESNEVGGDDNEKDNSTSEGID